MPLLASFCVLVAGTLLGLHVLSALLAWRRWRRPPLSDAPTTGLALTDVAPAPVEVEPISVVRPVHGLDAIDETTLATTFALSGARHEVIFCAEREDDPAVPFVRRQIERHPHVAARLLVGQMSGSPNPKLDNLAKGWREARHDLVVLADSNLLLPPDYLARLDAAWRPGIGLVSAPPLGTDPQSFWAEVECAFLNTYQGRWQYAACSVGYGFAQGKTLCLRKSTLAACGGFDRLASELAEDAAATKLIRAGGLGVRLVDRPFSQPLGCRTRGAVWQRQVRWAQLRRLAFPLHYAGEVLTSPLAPLAASLVAAEKLEVDGTPVAAAVLSAWYATEAWLARTARLHLSWRSPVAWLVRDLMLLPIWLVALLRSGYEWRGNRVDVAGPTAGTRPQTG